MSDTKKKPRPKVKKPYVRKGRKTKLMKMAKRVPKHWMDREDEKEREKNPKKKPPLFIVVFRNPKGDAFLSINNKTSDIHLRTDKSMVILFNNAQVAEKIVDGFAILFAKAHKRQLSALGYNKVEIIPTGKK